VSPLILYSAPRHYVLYVFIVISLCAVLNCLCVPYRVLCMLYFCLRMNAPSANLLAVF